MTMLERARGCLLGQLAGDALGSQVEFRTKASIAGEYPHGVRAMRDGGSWNTLAGQPTDDSEIALLLARLLISEKIYDPDQARERYVFWLNSWPFDVGFTIRTALGGKLSTESEANGAMMRISPLAIFGATRDETELDWHARQDAALTHPSMVCQDANVLFVRAIALALREPISPAALYQRIVEWADEPGVAASVKACVRQSAIAKPVDYVTQQGWVLIAFGNALYRLVHSSNFEEALVETVMEGGDTDTNAAIAGALLGAVFGSSSIPERWISTVLNCRPAVGIPNVHQPRPEVFWPVDALEVAEKLLLAGGDLGSSV